MGIDIEEIEPNFGKKIDKTHKAGYTLWVQLQSIAAEVNYGEIKCTCIIHGGEIKAIDVTDKMIKLRLT